MDRLQQLTEALDRLTAAVDRLANAGGVQIPTQIDPAQLDAALGRLLEQTARLEAIPTRLD